MPATTRAAVAALALCLAAPGTALAQKSGGTLRFYHSSNPPSASIHEEATIATVQPFSAVFNNLVLFDQQSKRNSPDAIVPELATTWEWNGDRTELSFKLREGVKWHDGKPFTSADVKCTWDTILETRQSGWRKNPRQEWYFNLKEVRTNGDHDVSFKLGRPQTSFLTFLAGAFSPVYPCHVDGREMRQKPIGTGPFKVAEFKPNDSIKLVKNTEYWRPGRPYLDAIEYKVIVNRSTRILAFTNGDFDMTFSQDVTIPLLRDVKAQAPAAICEQNPSNTQGQLLVNWHAAPFDNPQIRRAMMLALDRQGFIEILSEGQAKTGGAMLPPPEGVWGLAPEMTAGLIGYGGDLEKTREEAREIMAGLGYGPQNPLRIKVATRNLQSYRDPAVILIDQLKAIFIEGELQVLETSLWYAMLAKRDFSVAWNVSGIGIDDPDVVFYENYACGSERNYANYCNKELQEKFDLQSATADIEQRKKIVHDIDRTLQEQGARPVIYHSVSNTCRHPYVKGITLAQNAIYNHWRLEDAWLDK